MCPSEYCPMAERFRLTFVAGVVKLAGRYLRFGCGAPTLDSRPVVAGSLVSERAYCLNVPSFQVSLRHPWRESANDACRVLLSNPRSVGLQRGAHLPRRSSSLSGSCRERRLRVTGYPHGATPSFPERQPVIKKDERYGGGVA